MSTIATEGPDNNMHASSDTARDSLPDNNIDHRFDESVMNEQAINDHGAKGQHAGLSDTAVAEEGLDIANPGHDAADAKQQSTEDNTDHRFDADVEKTSVAAAPEEDHSKHSKTTELAARTNEPNIDVTDDIVWMISGENQPAAFESPFDNNAIDLGSGLDGHLGDIGILLAGDEYGF